MDMMNTFIPLFNNNDINNNNASVPHKHEVDIWIQRRIQDLNFMGLAFKVLIIELVVLLKIRGSYTLLFAILVDFYT